MDHSYRIRDHPGMNASTHSKENDRFKMSQKISQSDAIKSICMINSRFTFRHEKNIVVKKI